jgi:hypothetical protein
MDVGELRRLLAHLRDVAGSFTDASDLDLALGQVKACVSMMVDADDIAIVSDLTVRGGLSLFVSAKAAKDRGESADLACRIECRTLYLPDEANPFAHE